MDDRVEILDRRRRELAGGRVPHDVAGTLGNAAPDARDGVPAALQKGHELRADQPGGAGHPDAQPGLGGVGRMAGQVGQRALVTKAKEALQEAARRHAAEHVAGGAQRQAELDVVLDHAAIATLGDEGVGVLPLLERAVELTVGETAPGLDVLWTATQRPRSGPLW